MIADFYETTNVEMGVNNERTALNRWCYETIGKIVEDIRTVLVRLWNIQNTDKRQDACAPNNLTWVPPIAFKIKKISINFKAW